MSTNNVPIYGNYHGYYSKRPSIRDPRLALLPPELLLQARVLDVGCNEGWVTCEIAQSWGAHRVVGVDIDDTLIRGAWRRRRTVWSLQGPEDETETKSTVVLGNKRRRRDSNASRNDDTRPGEHTCIRSDHFPMSLENMFGPLPIPPSQNRGKHKFPRNVSFRTADWTNEGIPEDADGYDVVVAFSISKWIHLNGGDDGLTTFFRRVHAVLKPGGTFVLEPQAWDTYSKAKRMDPKLKENARNLALRPEAFEELLRTIGFGPALHLGIIGDGGFRRPVDSYVKQ